MTIKNFFHSFWGGVIIVVIVLALGYIIWGAVASGGVSFAIIGVNDIKTGEIGEFYLKYINNSRLPLEDCSIEVALADGVISIDGASRQTLSFNLGEVPARTANEKVIKLMFTGEPQTAKNIEAVFNYRPKGLSSVFYKKDVKAIVLRGSIFNLNINLPEKVFIGQAFPFEINWANLTLKTFENIELRADWPNGFSFISANPDITKEQGVNNKWFIGIVDSNREGKISVQGLVDGQEGETKRVVLTLGLNQNNEFLPLATTQGFVTLASNPLHISVFVNGDINYNADLGEKLDFTITYKNNYSVSLRDLKITTQLNGDVFDFSTLRAPNAVFSSRLQTLTWLGNKVPSLYVLNPGEKGTLNFSVKLKKDWPMKSLAQKNIVLEAKTTIKSSSIPEELKYQVLPEAFDINIVKLNSDCGLKIGGYFRDPPALIANTGKLPLKVDQPTDFTIHWKIINTYNTINNVTVMTTLPLWAEWTSQISGNYGDNPPVYNVGTRQVSWTIPVVPVGAGAVQNAYEAIFQIKITPLSSHINQAVELINETSFSATDAFTLKNINIIYPSVVSNNLDDPTVIPNDGIVRP